MTNSSRRFAGALPAEHRKSGRFVWSPGGSSFVNSYSASLLLFPAPWRTTSSGNVSGLLVVWLRLFGGVYTQQEKELGSRASSTVPRLGDRFSPFVTDGAERRPAVDEEIMTDACLRVVVAGGG